MFNYLPETKLPVYHFYNKYTDERRQQSRQEAKDYLQFFDIDRPGEYSFRNC